MFKITYYSRNGGKKVRTFATLAAAQKVATAIFEATGIVVGIENT